MSEYRRFKKEVRGKKKRYRNSFKKRIDSAVSTLIAEVSNGVDHLNYVFIWEKTIKNIKSPSVQAKFTREYRSLLKEMGLKIQSREIKKCYIRFVKYRALKFKKNKKNTNGIVKSILDHSSTGAYDQLSKKVKIIYNRSKY